MASTTGKRAPSTDVAVPSTPTAAVVAISQENRNMFAQMVTMVPGAEDDGINSILAQILKSATWAELSDPWNTEKSAQMVDIDLRIDSITRHDSDYSDGLGVFLLIRGKRMDTDQDVAFACGGVSVVAQLVTAYALQAYPLYGTLRKADKPSKRGYYPLHLEITGSAAGILQPGQRRASEDAPDAVES